MFREAVLFRGLIVAAACGLAIFLGFQLTTPDEKSSLAWIVGIMLLLTLPLLIRWHHSLAIVCWNFSMIVFFLPGHPNIGLVVLGISLGISIVNRTLRRGEMFIHNPATTYPLIFLALVILATAHMTGGIHGRAFGSDTWGASRYIWMLGAIIGYFALIAQPVPLQKANLMASLFFLSGITCVISDLIYLGGSGFGFLSLIFPQTSGAYLSTDSALERFDNTMRASQFVCWFMFMRYGIRGIFSWYRPWRLVLFVMVFAAGLLGGFRSFTVLTFLVFLIQFYLERLFRSSLLWILLAGMLLAGGFLGAFSDRLPLPVQRSVSFIPGIKINAAVRRDAQSTVDWRLEMWRTVLPLVPKYFWLGKGYTFDGTDFYLTSRKPWFSSYEAAMISDDYHNGILTLIIPLGIWGVLGFAAFCWGALRSLYANYRHGDPELKRVNTFLLAFFIGRLIFYVTLYGEFTLDLLVFTGIVGLSLTLNGGVKQKAVAIARPATAELLRPPLARRRLQPV
ncbi:MAG: O-antigen ligase family protein [Limisphaerales bacterium]